MSITAYTLSVPLFTRALNNLIGLLEKAEANATERKFDVNILMGARLAPDMNPLSFQVQNSTDRAKFALSRLTGRDAPSWPDDEKTIADLKARLRKALDYIATFSEADLAGAEDRQVTVRSRGGEVTASGQDYLVTNVLPNFYFHVTTAYALLRQNGVPVGKADYIG